MFSHCKCQSLLNFVTRADNTCLCSVLLFLRLNGKLHFNFEHKYVSCCGFTIYIMLDNWDTVCSVCTELKERNMENDTKFGKLTFLCIVSIHETKIEPVVLLPLMIRRIEQEKKGKVNWYRSLLAIRILDFVSEWNLCNFCSTSIGI